MAIVIEILGDTILVILGLVLILNINNTTLYNFYGVSLATTKIVFYCLQGSQLARPFLYFSSTLDHLIKPHSAYK